MIENNLQSQLQLLVKASAPPLIEVSNAPLETPKWRPGERLPAHVLTSLPNGRFQAKIGDHVLDMNLPRNTQPGDTVELTLVSTTPRLTFALAQDLAAGQSRVSISDSARFLGALLEKLATTDSKDAAPMSRSPVLAGPPSDTKLLAQNLHAALSKSGLFYESHQAEWATGKRTLGELLQEPQAQFSRKAGDVPTAAAETRVPLPGTEMKQAGAAQDPVHPQTYRLVQQQLDVLETRQLVWQGEVWPGQQMQWRIDEPRDQLGEGGESPDAAEWQTTLRLQFPRLGDLTATLGVGGKGIRLNIHAGDEGAVGIMTQQLGELRAAFEAVGIRLVGAQVSHDES